MSGFEGVEGRGQLVGLEWTRSCQIELGSGEEREREKEGDPTHPPTCKGALFPQLGGEGGGAAEGMWSQFISKQPASI